MKNIYGEIMGDVVNSSNFSSLEKLTEYLEKAFKIIQKRHKIYYQIYRGDAFTIIADKPQSVFTIYRLIQNLLYDKYKIRVVMCYDVGQLKIFNENPGYCQGPLLQHLGKLFDSCKTYSQI